MSIPDTIPATQQQEPTLTVEQQIANYASQMRKDETFKLPEEVESNELLKLAVMSEKRRLDTVASYTKSQQALRVAEAERAELLATSKVTLTNEQLTELETLKETDVEAYYAKRTEFENLNKTEFNKKLESVASQISAEEEISRRVQVLDKFQATHNLVIDDDFIENELPARITKKLETGAVTFEQFLDEVLEFVNKPIKTSVKPNQPDLSKEAGSSTPAHDEKQVKETVAKQWEKTIF